MGVEVLRIGLSSVHTESGKATSPSKRLLIFCTLTHIHNPAMAMGHSCNFLMKSHKIANNSAATEAREKISINLNP